MGTVALAPLEAGDIPDAPHPDRESSAGVFARTGAGGPIG